MLSREEILKKLKDDPDWTPSDGATPEEWELYDEVQEELFGENFEDDDDEEDGDFSGIDY